MQAPLIVKSAQPLSHVEETRFGLWFLQTETWTRHVLERAMQDLARLLEAAGDAARESYPVVVDVGCGFGRSLPKLHHRFRPRRLIGMDVDSAMLDASAREVLSTDIQAELIQCSSDSLSLEDNSVDLLFCHQTFHHLVEQERAIREFYRVLKPGGVMLFAESTKRYIESWTIRYLFRHPMEVQKTAGQYLALVRATGFEVPPQAVSTPYLWWSRPDLGLLERALRIKPRPDAEQTLINLVARKPR
ncbi:MAG TPA: class I SAM-dependent methyltransferase [Herbaspirillum sp.]|jgi:SAM-dependent methyltransferase